MSYQSELAALLIRAEQKYNQPAFIKDDPISIPHLFSEKEDIEIAAFLSASIAWGQRPVIIKNAMRLMHGMEMAPYDFIVNAKEKDYLNLSGFVHRTFNFDDLVFFLSALKNIYINLGGLENVFFQGYKNNRSVKDALVHFRQAFFTVPHMERSHKHVSNVLKNSSAKRLNLFLRWMVRKDNRGVDFGLWNSISMAHLFVPLDIHTGNTARKLKLLNRKQSNWKSVEELTFNLQKLDKDDPVKFDFALFGLGLYGHY